MYIFVDNPDAQCLGSLLVVRLLLLGNVSGWGKFGRRDDGTSLVSFDGSQPPQHQQHPVTWQPNSDGTKMIGRMILTKNMAAAAGGGGGGGPAGGGGGLSGGGSSNPSSASILGLKVVGGKRVDNGRLAAIVEKVKRGSVADTIGHVRPGTSLVCPSVCLICPLC